MLASSPSASTYRLEAPRARPALPPLRNSPRRASWKPSSSPNDDAQTLLYELPESAKAVVASPPPPRSGHKSPTSPRGFSKGADRRARTKSPPGGRARSATPGALQGDLEGFAEHCRAWYYNQDDAAGRLMTQTLSTLPPAQRAPFARLQASIRAQFHVHVQLQRQAEFSAHLSSISPGQSISAASRSDWQGAAARKERLDKFARFVARWCTSSMPGTKPFFEGLWAVMRLEVIPENLGGAGQRRIDWEIDDAVFKETAGKDFMFEAIDILKGVLAFEETPSSKRAPTWSRPGSLYEGAPEPAHARTQSQPLSSPTLPLPAGRITSTTRRARAPSDPFSDARPPPVPALTPSSEMSAEELESQLPTPATGAPAFVLERDAEEEDADGYMRVWTAPDLSDPEYVALLACFPAFVAQRAMPRFAAQAGRGGREVDVEEGVDDESGDEGMRVRCGTGEMWPGVRMRSEGYRGSWWTRFVLWWKRLFC